MMDMRRDVTVRGGAALVLIAFLVGVVSLYDPLPHPVEFHIALPISLVVAIVVIGVWHRSRT
ncbi:hypothetical protein [Halocatena pleomorpha]|uniref:Uncharacterized protein n=1 Tax=Halocatena pleomorpha TaxID=1785090 RepID=A0A3P3RJL0_9EURY|nr:hypothetical protein [Halocatena pleomorpha]RRJ33514.1 hypothetical protein EIK79_01555 [Halocatena pleomorpha]